MSIGRLLASGRDTDIYEYGPGLVLRRSRAGRSMAAEARVMEHARAHGYPVPAVTELSTDGTDLVMERVDGPVMLDEISRKPWTLGSHAATLARLHRQLHTIEAPPGLALVGAGGADLLHLDLHPLNVILSRRGPMVIDWTNAARGAGDVDVALTWALIACADAPARGAHRLLIAAGRRLFLRSFLAQVDRDAVRRQLPLVVAWRLDDPNLSDQEKANMRRLVQREKR